MPAYKTLPFEMEDIPPRAEDTDAVLRVAQVAGAALKALREGHDITLEKASEWLKVKPAELARAESGHLIEVTRRGRLIDLTSTLLVLMAMILKEEAIRIR
jgi:hypothetical protein